MSGVNFYWFFDVVVGSSGVRSIIFIVIVIGVGFGGFVVVWFFYNLNVKVYLYGIFVVWFFGFSWLGFFLYIVKDKW